MLLQVRDLIGIKLIVLGVIIFGSVRFLSKKLTKPVFLKKKQNRFKPTSFGSVILEQKPVQTDRFWFGSVFSFFSGLGSVQFFQFQIYKIKTELN
jgi:hypothetical protein